jgi:hypothetical protein
MPKTRVHGFPVVAEDFDVTRAKVLWEGEYENLVDLLGGGEGAAVTLTSLGVSTYMQTLLNDTSATEAKATLEADFSNVLYDNVADTLTAGFATTPYNAGTKTTGTYTPNDVNGNMQYAINGGAHTLAPPTNNGTIIIQYTNNASAGTITTSGFTKVSGDAPGTTDGDDFLAYITKINGFSHLTWVALQ